MSVFCVRCLWFGSSYFHLVSCYMEPFLITPLSLLLALPWSRVFLGWSTFIECICHLLVLGSMHLRIAKPLFESLSLSSRPSQDYFNLTMDWLLTCQFTWNHSYWAHAEFYHFWDIENVFWYTLPYQWFLVSWPTNTFESVAMCVGF
jgi:hypothetical protein